MRKTKARKELFKDFIFILLGVIIAITLSHFGAIKWVVNIIGNQIASSFLSGLFFTSVFTVAPSSVAFANISGMSTLSISFWGSIGALCGDMILFYFIRDRFTEHIMASMKPSVVKNILSSFHFGFMKWIAPLIGFIILATPLPNEFGLMLLGLSKIKVLMLIPISFSLNFVAINTLLYFAKLI